MLTRPINKSHNSQNHKGLNTELNLLRYFR